MSDAAAFQIAHEAALEVRALVISIDFAFRVVSNDHNRSAQKLKSPFGIF